MRTDKKVQIILYKNPKNPQFLILLTDQGEESFWQGVTGGVEDADPSLKAAASREILEELGLRVLEDKLVGPLHQYRFRTSLPEAKGSEVEEFCFTAEVSDYGDLKLSEHKDFKWLPFDEAIKLIDHRNPKIFLRKIMSFLNLL